MAVKDSSLFYAQLPVHMMRVSELFVETELFIDVPEDWHVVITDIKKSTVAVTKGAHEDVNLIATGSIIAALNLARKKKVAIPFFFGGDGATLLVPDILLHEVLEALSEHRINALQVFDLDLRLGSVPVRELYDNGYKLRIANAKISDIFATPIILGSGLSYAEKLIKEEEFISYEKTGKISLLDLNGMECRWDKLKPPTNTSEVISLLVAVVNENDQAIVFKQVLETLDKIYGDPQKRKPFSIANLKIDASINRIYREMIVRIRKLNLLYLLGNHVISMIGKFYLKYTNPGRAYLKEIIDLTDTLVLDGRLNTVISSTTQQRNDLEKDLNTMESEGKIFYGLYVSQESIMSCYVKQRHNEHIHFVDGANGGYTQASKVLKAKLKSH